MVDDEDWVPLLMALFNTHRKPRFNGFVGYLTNIGGRAAIPTTLANWLAARDGRIETKVRKLVVRTSI
jgi:hypothetical protein